MNWQFHLTSSKECINVDEAFDSLIKLSLNRKYGINDGEIDQEEGKNMYKLSTIDDDK